jgi:hypothetical protein
MAASRTGAALYSADTGRALYSPDGNRAIHSGVRPVYTVAWTGSATITDSTSTEHVLFSGESPAACSGLVAAAGPPATYEWTATPATGTVNVVTPQAWPTSEWYVFFSVDEPGYQATIAYRKTATSPAGAFAYWADGSVPPAGGTIDAVFDSVEIQET